MRRIPEHLFWPGLVVSILMFAVVCQLGLLWAAHSDQGVQIEESYYQRALQWDELQALRERSHQLGWRIDVQSSTEKTLTLTVVDRAGSPVVGVVGELELRRPSLAKAVSTAALEAVPGQPGFYYCQNKMNQKGLWDLVFRLRKDDADVLVEMRRDV